jgi:leucyl aminopeptidase
MTGEKALRPGDILKIRNGMTVEVLNTDAEGRLILADALSWAAEKNPDLIIDVATLTGAQAVALGDEIGGMYSTSDEVAAQLEAAANATGETMWRLPLFDNYESHIDSDVADIKNIGKAGRAGSISAALFLRRFTAGRPWVHLDIAGPSRSDSSRGYYQRGATAFGARTLLQYLINRSR